MRRLVIVLIALAFSIAYWSVVGPWAGHATYGWAADPAFGITDAMSPWPNIIAIVGYLSAMAILAGSLLLAKRHRKAAEEKR